MSTDRNATFGRPKLCGIRARLSRQTAGLATVVDIVAASIARI
jgi:hypothetical protein